jgi:hypothetical protein
LLKEGKCFTVMASRISPSAMEMEMGEKRAMIAGGLKRWIINRLAG